MRFPENHQESYIINRYHHLKVSDYEKDHDDDGSDADNGHICQGNHIHRGSS